MKISTHIGLKEHHGIDDLYDGHFEPVLTDTVDKVIAHLESFLYLDSPEFESLRWEGPNGWFYQGAAAGEMLRAEIASLRDGSHPQFATDPIDAAFALIAPEAIGTGRDADGTLDGSDDWDHPSAAAARQITADLGMEWDFTTWAAAKSLAHKSTPAPTMKFTYATDSTSGTFEAPDLDAAYQIQRSKISDSMVDDGATLWVEGEDGQRITLGNDGA